MDHGAAQEMRTAEQTGGGAQITGQNELANLARTDLDTVNFYRAHHDGFEAEFAPQLHHHGGVARAFMTKADAMADHYGFNSQFDHQVVVNEIAWSHPAEGAIEMQHQHPVNTGLAEKIQLVLRGHQHLGRALRGQHFGGQRIEG